MLKIKTEELQKIVSQLSTLSPNKLLEITRYWHIAGDKEKTIFAAYDGSNFVKVTYDKPSDLDVIVKAEQFGKLIDRTTVAEVTLKKEETSLTVIANGEYKVDIVQEDEEYPNFDELLKTLPEPELLAPSIFSKIVNVNASAVSRSAADGIYTGYLIHPDKAITTDAIRVCINPIESISQPALVPPTLINILASIDSDKIKFFMLENEAIYCQASNIEVYGKLMEGMDEYVDVSQVAETEFPGTIALPTQNIQSIIERLTLFMNAFDRGSVVFNFTKDYLEVSTTTGSYEKIKYFTTAGQAKATVEFKCVLNSILLKDIISTINDDHFDISYGNEALIKIESNKVEYYLALSEEE